MINFRQEDRARLIIPLLAYLALLLILVFVLIGSDAAAEFVNRGAEGGVRRFSFVAGAVALLPVFLLVRFMSAPTEVSFDKEKMTVRRRNKPDLDIRFADIKKVIFNKPMVNGIYLYGSSGDQLHAFVPQNGRAVAEQLLKEILARKPMRLTEENAAFRGKVIQKTYVSN